MHRSQKIKFAGINMTLMNLKFPYQVLEFQVTAKCGLDSCLNIQAPLCVTLSNQV